MKNSKRIAIICIAVLFIFGFIMTSLFVVQSSTHDCVGDGCSVCAQVKTAVESFFGTKVTTVAAESFVVAFVFTVFLCCKIYEKFEYYNLVSLHKKLSI